MVAYASHHIFYHVFHLSKTLPGIKTPHPIRKGHLGGHRISPSFICSYSTGAGVNRTANPFSESCYIAGKLTNYLLRFTKGAAQ